MRYLLLLLMLSTIGISQTPPPIGPGVSHDLAIWRAARYSDIRYKLNLTLEKMSPVLKGTIEIRVNVSEQPALAGGQSESGSTPPIVLDWRKIAGHEKDSTISKVSINGVELKGHEGELYIADSTGAPYYILENEHIIFRDRIKPGENVIKLDFTSPILTSGSAITRYVDKEDGAEYIYSLFVPSDASTAFPVFDQPDLKARFTTTIIVPLDWKVISNVESKMSFPDSPKVEYDFSFIETKPISTYVFAFAAGPWEKVSVPGVVATGAGSPGASKAPVPGAPRSEERTPADLVGTQTKDPDAGRHILNPITGAEIEKLPCSPEVLNCKIASFNEKDLNFYVRRSQAAKFQPHAAEVFRLTREGIKYLETYFDYKFPFPKYDLVLIPEFPFGGMEHAGATFLKESSVIFPTEPTKGDYISRANLIFHETAHQWFGDTVTMKWFDDLWLKEGFAEFMAYKTLENVMPEANAWKVFYERNKQAAYATDATKGTTPIYQPIDNLSSAKSAYGNIVYRKAPSFLRQAEFYLGPDKFQTGVRAFLKKHEYGNAGWEDLVKEFEGDSEGSLKKWASSWVLTPGLATFHAELESNKTGISYVIGPHTAKSIWPLATKALIGVVDGEIEQFEKPLQFDSKTLGSANFQIDCVDCSNHLEARFVFPNYQDYGYGIFLLDPKSRDYVLKHIGEEKDPFLRSMMWGSLWDSVREGELGPREYVELVVKQLRSASFSSSKRGTVTTREQAEARTLGAVREQAKACTLDCGEMDETIVASILGRVSTALNYYIPGPELAVAYKQGFPSGTYFQPRLEDVLLDRLQHAETPGQRITFYRAYLNIASTAKGREVLKEMLRQASEPPVVTGGSPRSSTSPVMESRRTNPPDTSGGSDNRSTVPLRTKDKFDIVTRLIILGDPDAPKLLADLEKTETSDDAKRYAYAAHAAFPTAENRAKFWNDLVNNKDISESWIEAAIVPFNSISHEDLSLPYLQRALAELPNLKRSRKIFFVNGWLAAFIGGQRSQAALDIVNKFLADNPGLDKDLRLKILENSDVIERAVRIRGKFGGVASVKY